MGDILKQFLSADMKKAPKQGTPEYDAEHKAREVPTQNFEALDREVGGEFGRGNISLNDRPVQMHDNGKDYSSLESITVEFDGKHVLLPTIHDGKLVSEEEAMNHYRKTGRHLGIFASSKEASEHAVKLERRQQAYYEAGPGRHILDRAKRSVSLSNELNQRKRQYLDYWDEHRSSPRAKGLK